MKEVDPTMFISASSNSFSSSNPLNPPYRGDKGITEREESNETETNRCEGINWFYMPQLSIPQFIIREGR